MDENIKLQIERIRKECEIIKPLVVIVCITYNHKEYIRDALEGFVNQKTKFSYVAIVHDDASTDGTNEIVQEYAEKYSNIIKPIYEIENQYSKRDGSMGKVVNGAIKATGSTYIALCEGDDYWLDSYKLQKQIDFLETHPDYSMCFHKILPLGEGVTLSDNTFAEVKTREYLPKDLLSKWIVQTSSFVLRQDVFMKTPKHKDFCIGDNVLLATCIDNGRIFGFEDTMGVYRRTENGWTLNNRKNKEKIYNTNLNLIRHYKRLNTFFPSLKSYYDKRIMRAMNGNMIICFKSNDARSGFKIVRDGLKEYKLKYLVYSLSYLFKGIGRKIIKR